MKKVIKNIEKRIKQFYIVRLFKAMKEVHDLTDKIGELEKDKQKLNDKVNELKAQAKNTNELENSIASMEIVIASADKSLREKYEVIKKLNNTKIELQNQLFIAQNELATANIQKEEYEAQIKELKSDRYLIKKVRSGRKPNTNKTKISRPMANKVVKYMRGEHE